MLLVRVSATSANCCVGFDCLGIALNLYNTFTFEKSDNFSFKGFKEKYCSCDNNLVYYSYKRVFDKLNKKTIPVEIGFSGDIPVSRGLGSSSSLIVAGVYAANYFLGNPLNDLDMLNICGEIEGHPDNVAPAIFGGLVASFKDENGYRSIKYPINSDLKFITVIPPFELSTNQARSVLPDKYNRFDVVNNLSRIVNLPYAFSNGDIELLFNLFEDKIHEPYRGKLIDGYFEIKKICQEYRLPFAISGSGSTMLIISKDLEIIEKIKKFNYEIKILSVADRVLVGEGNLNE